MLKTVRSLFFFALLGVGLTLAGQQAPQNDPNAASAPPPPPQSSNEKAPLRQRLAFTADQQAQLRSINHDKKAQLNAIQSDPTLRPRDRKQRIKNVNLEADSKIRAMLNDNQRAEYDQILRERRDARLRKRETALPPQ
jgi:hypothetical protein